MSDFYKLKAKKNGKEYILNVCTQDTEQNIIGTKNFSKLTVNSKNIVRSVNGVDADENGNVTITAGAGDIPDYTAGVTLSNGSKAPANGIIVCRVSDGDHGSSVSVNGTLVVTIGGTASVHSTVNATTIVGKDDIIGINYNASVNFYPFK